jgi:hypothetical protein
LNIFTGEICDVVIALAQGPYGAKPNCGLWPNERCALFIRGIKITSNWKEILTQQLLDGYLQEYLMEKEQWTTHSFQNICWKRQETALKQISKARQAQTEKMCHDLRYTGARHAQWYGEVKPSCMCGDNEYWRHVLTCKSLDAELIRADSWSKLRKGMDKWGMSQDMWLTIDNGVCHYTMNPKKREHDNMPTEPSQPFGPTFDAPRNRLKVAFRAQSRIGWDNFLKGRLSLDWITCMDHHFQSNGSKLTGQRCITKLIVSLWEHMDRLWTYRNNRYHENTHQKVARYNMEALDRRNDEIWEKHTGIIDRLHNFQSKHFENRQQKGNLNYESKRCWVNLAEQYINEESSPIRSEIYTLSKLLGARNGVG